MLAERPQFSIVENQQWWVEANFKETDVGHMPPGLVTVITIDMYPDLKLTGTDTSLGRHCWGHANSATRGAGYHHC